VYRAGMRFFTPGGALGGEVCRAGARVIGVAGAGRVSISASVCSGFSVALGVGVDSVAAIAYSSSGFGPSTASPSSGFSLAAAHSTHLVL
jgi:hypothetical protein